MEFGKQLAKYRKEHDIDQKDIAELLNITSQTVSNYETGKNKIPYEKLITLCNHYRINPLDLIDADLTFDLDKEKQQEQLILSAYNKLPSDSDKKRIVDFILETGEYDSSNIVEPEPTIIYRFPVFQQEAAAGVGRLDISDGYSMEEFVVDNIPDEAAFVMEIAGESMYDERTDYLLHTGSKVLIDPKVTKYSLDDMVVIANFKGKTICKRYIVKDTYILFKSDNDDFKKENRKSTDDPDHKIIGVVLGVIEDEKFIPVK